MKGTKQKYRFLRIVMTAAILCSIALAAGCSWNPLENWKPGATVPTAQQTVPTAPTETTAPTVTAGDAALVSLRQAMIETPQLFAVAYFGYWESLDSDSPVDPYARMQQTCPQLCEDLPFLLEIPKERVVGEAGDLFCIVPLDEAAAVTVKIGTWDENSEQYSYHATVYTANRGEPILLFCNNSGWEADTQLNISGPSGTVQWYPRLDENLCVMPAYDGDGEKLFYDFTAYGEILAADYKRLTQLTDWGWELPTAEQLTGNTWVWYGYSPDGRETACQMTFREDTLSVRWNDGVDTTDHEYPDAQWKLSNEDGFAVLTVDFREFAGVRRYNLLYSPTVGDLYVAMDALQDVLPIGWEPLYRVLRPRAVPAPTDMAGAWVLAWTEVEGDRNEALPGSQTVVITVGEDGGYRISYTSREFPDGNYYDKELVVFPFELYPGCGNGQWLATVNYTGQFGTEYDLTLLDADTLLMRSCWELDGAPMVGYECYQRVS